MGRKDMGKILSKKKIPNKATYWESISFIMKVLRIMKSCKESLLLFQSVKSTRSESCNSTASLTTP
jgi:hypothetical protein